MTRLNLRHMISLTALAGTIAFAACLTAGAQTTIVPPEKKPAPAAKTATLKPATKATAVKSSASQTAQPAASIVTPASSQTVINQSAPVSGATPANPLSGMTSTSPTGASAGNMSTSVTQPTAGDTRAPIAVQGVGSFVGAGWTLIAYGCFRSGTRLFCDFDTSYQKNVAARNNIWNNVNLVDDGGKITSRHNAFFVGEDGSQFPTAYVSSTPVRFIIEYDDVNPRYTSVSLVRGAQRIQSVPVTPEDASKPGSIPARGSKTAQAPGQTAATGVQSR